MRTRWTRPALRDLADIHAHIAEHDPAAALKATRLLQVQAEGLAAHPRMGRPGRIEGTRELVVAGSPFVVAYRLTETSVDILAVRHGARQWPERMGE